MEAKLRKIFEFLEDNRCYNHELQTKCYIADISPYDSVSEKILSLLYRVVNTQSQINMDMLAISFQNFNENPNCFDSLDSFLTHLSNENIEPNNYGKFDLLFLGMQDQPGWGAKTAALFVKSIYHLHNGDYGDDDELKIWDDVPETIEDGDIIRLPVDEVIFQIFRKISPKKHIKGKNGRQDKNINWTFNNINEEIYDFVMCEGDIEDIEVWDDLWFWGFFTQAGGGTNREFGWNENKYWSQRDTSKDTDTINDIKNEAETFINKINE